MNPRRKVALIATLAVTCAVAFGVRSFRQEVASIRKRQSSGAARCAALVREAEASVESAGRLGADLQGRRPSAASLGQEPGVERDPCRAAETALRATELMLQAREACGPWYDKAPTLTTNASIARMDGFRRTMDASCREAGSATEPG